MTDPVRRIRKPNWIRIYQSPARRRATDPALSPQYLRVYFAAQGWRRANGHAVFGSGDLGRILSVVDRKTGELKADSNADRAVAIAISKGLIHASSTTDCLVMMPGDVDGPHGAKDARCRVHDR